MLKKQLNLVDKTHWRINPDCASTTVNVVHSGTGRQAYPVVRDLIYKHNSADIWRYGEQCDGVQSTIKLLKIYSDKTKKSLKESW